MKLARFTCVIVVLALLGSLRPFAQQQCTRILITDASFNPNQQCPLVGTPGGPVEQTLHQTAECMQNQSDGSQKDLGPAKGSPLELKGTGVCTVAVPLLIPVYPCTLGEIGGIPNCVPGNCPPDFEFHADNLSWTWTVQNFTALTIPMPPGHDLTVPLCLLGTTDSQAMRCKASYGVCDKPCAPDPNTGGPPCPGAQCINGQWNTSTCPKDCDPTKKQCDWETCDTTTGLWNDNECLCDPQKKPCESSQCVVGFWTPCILPCPPDPTTGGPPCSTAICDIGTGKWWNCPDCPDPDHHQGCDCRADGWHCNSSACDPSTRFNCADGTPAICFDTWTCTCEQSPNQPGCPTTCQGNPTCTDGSAATCVDGTYQCSCDQSPDQAGCDTGGSGGGGGGCTDPCDECNLPADGCSGVDACGSGSICDMCGYCPIDDGP
jgi:hypothetical protein